MQMRLDWKFVLPLLVTVASVAVPVWLWQYDLRAKSLTVRIVSSVALYSPAASSMPGLQLTLDGKIIDSPILTTLELVNNGSKPIPSNDFEGPLELVVSANAALLGAKVASVVPSSLSAILETDAQTIRLKPLLLNQDDKITFTVLTSGPLPEINTRARIAGVSDVKVENLTGRDRSRKLIYGMGITAFAILGLYSFFGGALLVNGTGIFVFPGKALNILGFAFGTHAGITFALAQELTGFGLMNGILVLGGLAAGLGFIVTPLSKKWYWDKHRVT